MLVVTWQHVPELDGCEPGGVGIDEEDAMAATEARAQKAGAVGEGAAELTAMEQEILGFERQWWKYPGAKEQAIREKFDMSATCYYQTLNALIDSPAALAHDPLLVKRLARMRSSRQKARTAKRLGLG